MATSLHTQIDWKHATWAEACTAVETFTDRLGMPVDAGIFETVVVLNLLGLQTFQSCEGHLDHGCAYPWVTLNDVERNRQFTQLWMHVCKLEEEAKATGNINLFNRYLTADIELRLQRSKWDRDDRFLIRVTDLLDTFYADT